MARAYDQEAERIFVRAILHGVEFADLYEHIDPKMMYGQMSGLGDWQPILYKLIYQAARTLYLELRAIPGMEAVVAKLRSKELQIGQDIDRGMISAVIEKLYLAGAPSEAEARDARQRIFKSFMFRHAGKLIEESVELFKKTEDGDQVIDYIMQHAPLQINKTRDYEISDYFATRVLREDQIRAIQKGEDQSLQKVPFGIKGLDAETGGLSAGELAIGLLAPGRGKTLALIDSCGTNVERGNTPTLFTREMTNYEISLRFDSRFTGIAHPKFYSAAIEEKDFVVWQSKLSNIKGALRIVTMKRDFTVQRMREILLSLDWDYDTRIVYADYLGIMEPTHESDRRRAPHEVGMIVCEELKDLALERMTPIMTMGQLKPQSADKLKIGWDDVAIAKQAISNFANVAFAILSDEWLKSMGKSILQIMKLRAKSPAKELWDMFPQYDYIRIDSNPHGEVGHPAPQMQQNFRKDFVLDSNDPSANQRPQVVIRGRDGQPLKPTPSQKNN